MVVILNIIFKMRKHPKHQIEPTQAKGGVALTKLAQSTPKDHATRNPSCKHNSTQPTTHKGLVVKVNDRIM